MGDHAGDVGQLLADRYRLLLSPAEAEDAMQWRAYDTLAEQEVLVRQVPLPEVVEAELVDDGEPVPGRGTGAGTARRTGGRATRRPADPAVRRAVEAALAASRLPDHPRLGQVFDVFVEGDGLWIVSELLPARPLASLLAERPLSPHRAAEIGADLLAALRAVHAEGWTHRNVTARTVLVCDDGHAMLTGLAAGAAEDTLCGYDVLPRRSAPADDRPAPGPAAPEGGPAGRVSGGPSAEGPTASRPGGPQAGGPAGSGSATASAAGTWPDGPPADDRAAHGPAARDGGATQEPWAPGAEDAAESRAADRDQAGGGEADVAAWWEVQPARGVPWDDAHAYGGAEQRPGRPHEADGPAARAARRGAIAAYHAGVRSAPGHGAAEEAGDERWPFVPSPPGRRGEESRTDGQWWPFDEQVADPEAGSRPAEGPEWPFDESDDAAAATPPLPDGWEPAPRPGPRESAPPAPAGRGALGEQRARDARMAAVGAVTERWAPEQADGSALVGPAADLWALGALLFRAVHGRPPYPEENAAELVRLVCSRPPEPVEGCGPLQPVVESLLRRDPAARADAAELRGLLLAVVRAAPEPEVGRHTLVGPPSLAPGGPADPRRLPIVRRRGELVRRRRAAKRSRPQKPARAPRPPRAARPVRPSADAAPAVERHRHAAPPAPRAPRRTGSPHSLGRLLVGLVLLLLTGAVLYAMWFMPKQGASDDDGLRKERGSVGAPPPQRGTPQPSHTASAAGTPEPEVARTQEVPSGFRLYDAPSGFRIAVPDGWHHSGVNDRGQVRFDKGDFAMIVVKGRDSTEEFGGDPMAYQSEDEPELEPYRSSDWATAGGLRRIDVGGHAMAEGTFTWKDAGGREVYVRNRALILDGRYHLVLVIGPSDERDRVDRYFEGAVDTYRVLSR